MSGASGVQQRVLRAAVLAALAVVASTACTRDDAPAPDADRVIASTTWVGALARAAGAANVTVIAPAIIPDQAAFDPAGEDLAGVSGAAHVLYAETDAFAAELRTAAGQAHLVPVKPDHDPAAVRAEVTRLGEVFGTQAAAARWLDEFDAEVTGLSESLRGVAPIPPFTAVAQVDVARWATFAGVNVVGTYGPEPVAGDGLADLVAAKPKLLLANVHQPAGTPDIPGAIRVDLVNYPAEDLDLLAVFGTNAERIGATFGK